MRRIGLVLAATLTLAPLAAEAQPAAKVPLIGYVGNSTPSLEPKLLGAFREGLRDLGYVEGREYPRRVPVGRRAIRALP